MQEAIMSFQSATFLWGLGWTGILMIITIGLEFTLIMVQVNLIKIWEGLLDETTPIKEVQLLKRKIQLAKILIKIFSIATLLYIVAFLLYLLR